MVSQHYQPAIPSNIDVVVASGTDDQILVKDLPCYRLPNGDLPLESLLPALQAKGFSTINVQISYFSHVDDMFVLCDGEKTILPCYIAATGRIILKIKAIALSPVSMCSNDTMPSPPAFKKDTGRRRSKERTIGFIIEKVALWRRLYNGVQTQEGETLQYSLEEAAKKVGISKKSLDDYLLQLRFGRKYGFNFNNHKEDGVGTLRAFVKAKKAKSAMIRNSSTGREASAPMENLCMEDF